MSSFKSYKAFFDNVRTYDDTVTDVTCIGQVDSINARGPESMLTNCAPRHNRVECENVLTSMNVMKNH